MPIDYKNLFDKRTAKKDFSLKSALGAACGLLAIGLVAGKVLPDPFSGGPDFPVSVLSSAKIQHLFNKQAHNKAMAESCFVDHTRICVNAVDFSTDSGGAGVGRPAQSFNVQEIYSAQAQPQQNLDQSCIESKQTTLYMHLLQASLFLASTIRAEEPRLRDQAYITALEDLNTILHNTPDDKTLGLALSSDLASALTLHKSDFSHQLSHLAQILEDNKEKIKARIQIPMIAEQFQYNSLADFEKAYVLAYSDAVDFKEINSQLVVMDIDYNHKSFVKFQESYTPKPFINTENSDAYIDGSVRFLRSIAEKLGPNAIIAMPHATFVSYHAYLKDGSVGSCALSF